MKTKTATDLGATSRFIPDQGIEPSFLHAVRGSVLAITLVGYDHPCEGVCTSAFRAVGHLLERATQCAARQSIAALLFLTLTVSLQAAPFHRKPAPKPEAPAVAPAAAEPVPMPLPKPAPETPRFTVNPDGSVLRSKQADAELSDWIEGIQKEAELQKGRGDKAEAALGAATTRADVLQKDVQAVTDDRNTQAAAKDTALTERDAEHERAEKEKVARVAAEKHASHIKTALSLALAAILVLLFNYEFGAVSGWITKLVPALLPYAILVRIGGSVVLTGIAWGIVARFVCILFFVGLLCSCEQPRPIQVLVRAENGEVTVMPPSYVPHK